MVRKLLTVGIAYMALLFLQAGGHVFAEEGPPPVPAENQQAQAAPALQTYVSPFAKSDASLAGSRASRQESFQLPDYWDVAGVKVNLDYRVTQLAKDTPSSVTLSVNGKDFYSFRPAAADAKQRVSVAVPGEWLKKGTNTIAIRAVTRTDREELACSDDTPDQWLRIEDTSNIETQFNVQAWKGTISDFTQRFTGVDMASAGREALAVPAGGTPAELEAALYALSGFAKSNTLTGKPIPLYSYGSEKLQDKRALVLVAMYDRLPAELKSQLGTQDLSGKALISLVNLDKQPTLIITSADEQLLAKAGRFAANQALMKQVAASSKIIDAGTNADTPVVSISKQMKLTETGDEVKGANRQEKTYYMPLPANRSVAEGSRVNLDFRYAQNLDFNRSLVTVLINDTPIGSKKLTKELANGDKASFPIPPNLALSGNFALTVAFDLEMENGGCARPEDQMPWAYLTKDSLMQLSTKDRTQLLFNSYPYPFLRDGQYNQIAVVLPAKQDEYTYLAVSNVFNLLGRYAEGNTGQVKVYADQADAALWKESNIIAVGSYKDNKVIQGANKQLYFRYGEDGSGFVSNEKMSIEAEYGKRIGTLQLIESPYGSGRGLLAVTGATSDYTYLASKLIADDGSMYKVYGDGVVTDKDGNTSAYRFKKEAGDKSESTFRQALGRADVIGFATGAGLLIVLVMVSLILLFRKHTKKRGGDRETK